MADALPFAGPPCLIRPESAVTSSEASVSGGADVEESPRANLKGGGKPQGRPASLPMIAISLFRVRWCCLKRFGLKPANQVVEVPLQPLNAPERHGRALRLLTCF